MVEKITKLKIKGGKFEKDTPFEYFNDEKQRVTIVYGRNGSGKSTIAKGFRKLNETNDENIIDDNQQNDQIKVDLFDKDGNNINNDIKGKVVVFDEQYINENVAFVEDRGLKTITLIGLQNKKQNEIDKLKEEAENKEGKKQDANNKLKKYEDDKKTFEINCDIVLSIGDNNWRDRRKSISRKYINNNRIERDKILKLKLIEEKSQIYSMYDELLKRYNMVKNEEIKVDRIDEGLININIDIETIRTLMNKEVQRSENDSELNSIINKHFDTIEVTKEIFENHNYCPYCYRNIEDIYKDKVLKVIKDIQNKDVEHFQGQLRDILINDIRFDDIDKYNAIISENLLNTIKNSINECNSIIKDYNLIVDKKIANPFEKFDDAAEKLLAKYSDILLKTNKIRELFNQINNEIDKLENDKRKSEDLENKLIELNDKMAQFEIFENGECNKYFKSVSDYDKNETEILNLKDSITKLELELNNINENIKLLEEEKKNCKIACDKINEYLSYILFSKQRIRIELVNDNYVLKISGNDVMPNKVSTGERNIIALCYFFLDAMSEEKEDELYKKEKLYVIDDPVSSFDYDNRIGIMSFLRMQYDKILHGDKNSRLLILSHDILTIRDTYKCFKDIYKDKMPLKTFKLQNDKLFKLEPEENIYSKLLRDVYNYASNDEATDSDQSIGNKMRRVIEAFSTFLYRKGIEELSTNERIIAGFDNSEFYKNLMYRLVLHGESHLEEKIKNIGGVNNFFDSIDEDSKKKTARQILCLMHILNPLHIWFQLYERDENGNVNKAEEKINNKIKTIEKWENDFKLKNE